MQKAKRANKSAVKELTYNNFDKYAHNVTNTPIIKEQTILKSIDHKVLHCYNKQNCNA